MGPPARASAMTPAIMLGTAVPAIVGASEAGLLGLGRATLGRLATKEGMRDMLMNASMGAGINYALGRNPKEGVLEGLLLSTLGAGGEAVQVGRAARAATQAPAAIERAAVQAAPKYAAEGVAEWTPQQLGLELVEAGPRFAGEAEALAAKQAANARPALAPAGSEAYKADPAAVRKILEAGDPAYPWHYAKKSAEQIGIEQQRLLERAVQGEANLQASAKLQRSAPAVERMAAAETDFNARKAAREAAKQRLLADRVEQRVQKIQEQAHAGTNLAEQVQRKVAYLHKNGMSRSQMADVLREQFGIPNKAGGDMIDMILKGGQP